MNGLDILELRTLMQGKEKIPNNLIKNIISDKVFTTVSFPVDILYIIEKCFFPRITDASQKTLDELEEYIDNVIDQIVSLSSFNYSDNEILIYKKYIFYKILTISPIIDYKNYISEIEDILLIPVNEYNGAWIAKENLRLILLNLYTQSQAFNVSIEKIKQQITIARAVDEKRKKLINDSIDKIYFSYN